MLIQTMQFIALSLGSFLVGYETSVNLGIAVFLLGWVLMPSGNQ